MKNQLKEVSGLLGKSERTIQRFRVQYKSFKAELVSSCCKDLRGALIAFINYSFGSRLNNIFAINNIIDYFEKDIPQAGKDKKEIQERISILKNEIQFHIIDYNSCKDTDFIKKSEIRKRYEAKQERVEELEALLLS